MKMYITRSRRHNFARNSLNHDHLCLKLCLNYRKFVIVALLMVWCILTFLFISPSKITEEETLNKLHNKYDALKWKHDKLMLDHVSKNSTLRKARDDSSLEYEMLRHYSHYNFRKLFLSLNFELRSLMEEVVGRPSLQAILELTDERRASLLSDLERMFLVDGYEEWRRKTAADTSDLVQKRLYHLQNPKNCTAARKLICVINKECGLSCRIWKLENCMVFAYATERTVIVDYAGLEKWHFFKLSNSCFTCTDCTNLPEPSDKDYDERLKVVSISFKNKIYKEKKFEPEPMPHSVPEDLAPRVLMFNGDPASWWVGQMLKFLLKPGPDLQRSIDGIIDKLDFEHPIVGVHIHRAGEMFEADILLHIEDYMEHVRQFYDQLELTDTVMVRRVYLATDHVQVLKHAQNLYPNYKFVSDPSIAERMANSKYDISALAGLLADVIMLSRTDYLIGTINSQVSRLAYELMQTNKVDASKSFCTLHFNTTSEVITRKMLKL